ncbi:hypothetical protein [Shinella zoogloeoides]|uniref:hypothetical protein n=1 Tax=Shinella zoogloeoides TaxID=352475 RepID=UPI001F59F11B|nr:hypothetical protein [Shinella zoogloeoides]
MCISAMPSAPPENHLRKGPIREKQTENPSDAAAPARVSEGTGKVCGIQGFVKVCRAEGTFAGLVDFSRAFHLAKERHHEIAG